VSVREPHAYAEGGRYSVGLLGHAGVLADMEERFTLDTRDRPRLLLAMMDTLAAEDGRISFEGCLSQTELAKIKGVTDQEDGVLKRATLQPKLDFLVLPLTAESLSAIGFYAPITACSHQRTVSPEHGVNHRPTQQAVRELQGVSEVLEIGGQHTYPQKLPQRVIQALKDPR
jgi:hypothetical protein